MKRWNQIAKNSIFPLLSFLLIVIISKQLLLYDVLLNVIETLYPIMFGIILTLLFHPLVLKLAQHMRYRRAVYVVYLGMAGAIFLFLTFFLPSLYEQVQRLYEQSSSFFNWFHQMLQVLPNEIVEMKDELVSNGSKMVIDSMSQMAKQLMHLMIAYLTAFFLALDLPFFKHTLKKMISPHIHLSSFYQTMNHIIYHYLIGTAIDLSFLVITCGLILYIANFPGAFLYATVLALLNLWPYIGATLGFGLVVLVAFVSCDQVPYFALALVWIVQQLEANIIQPFIFHKTMDVRPFLALVFLFLSQGLLGIVGVLLSPIFAAIAQIAFRSYLHAKHRNEVGEWEDIWYDFDEVMKEQEIA